LPSGQAVANVSVATSSRRYVDPGKDLWLSVLESTGQPARFY